MGPISGPPRAPAAQNQVTGAPLAKLKEATPGRVMVTLRRKEGDVWSAKEPILSKPDPAPNPSLNDMTNQVLNGSQLVGRAADNVTSFLSGIRASFRTENVYVASSNQPKKKDQIAANNEDRL